jgi:hypothetical protein
MRHLIENNSSPEPLYRKQPKLTMTKNSKRTNTDNKITELGTILHRKLKIEQCEPHNETMVELGYFGRVGISFSTSVTYFDLSI